MSFDRDRLPDPAAYFESEGLAVQGRGKWRTTRCDFHDGSDSMRVNVESGAWVCMSCGVKGGDVLAYAMQRRGVGFVDAARALGAWVEDGRQSSAKPRSFTAGDALAVLFEDLHLCVVVISDCRAGVLPTDSDWQAFLGAAGRCIAIAQEARL